MSNNDSPDAPASSLDSETGGRRKLFRPLLRASHGFNRPQSRGTLVNNTANGSARVYEIPKSPARKRPATQRAPSETISIARIAAVAALEKKALNLEIIELVGKADYADYLVLMSGTSERHVRALADAIQEELAKHKLRMLSIEGLSAATWVLLDYGDVVVHVFAESTRGVFDLDSLWLDAARVPVLECE